jgi:outer membrane receptor protein involved in Fe transport
MYKDGLLYPNTSFWTQLTNPDLATGALATRDAASTDWSVGAGAMLDIDILQNTNLLLGARYDLDKAEAHDDVRFNEGTGTSANPGGFLPYSSAKNTDEGTSWSVSLSHQLPYGLRPYATYAISSLELASSNDLLSRSVVNSGQIGEAELKEVGLKSSMFGNKLQFTISGYDQTRNDVTTPDDPTAGADVSSTEYKGVELEVKWAPNRNTFLSAYALKQRGEYIVNGSCTSCQVSARDLGFMDVIDPATGAVIYPAEAFLYGGRAVLQLPKGSPIYQKRTGDPETQAGLTATYKFDNGIGLLLNTTWTSSVWADRLNTTKLPAATVVNTGISYDKGAYHFKLNGYNMLNERYFRAAISDFAAGQLVSVMPERRYEVTLKVDF